MSEFFADARCLSMSWQYFYIIRQLGQKTETVDNLEHRTAFKILFPEQRSGRRNAPGHNTPMKSGFGRRARRLFPPEHPVRSAGVLVFKSLPRARLAGMSS